MADLKTKIIEGEKDVKETLERTKLWEKKNPQVRVEDVKIFFLVKQPKIYDLGSRISSKKICRARIRYSV